MNPRTMLLLIAVLLLQAGQAVAFMSKGAGAAADTEACRLSCCPALTVAQGCCCIERAPSVPAPATPAPPPAQGRDLLPLMVWAAVVSLQVPTTVDAADGGGAFHADAAQALRQPVSLAVLHCAFLI